MFDEILANKAFEVRSREALVPLARVRERAERARPTREFRRALGAPGLSLIAEVKRRSPSCGSFRPDFDPVALAGAYTRNGARAVSVLADERFFGTGPDVVARVAGAPEVGVPVMWKDFVISAYQVYEARAAGADAVLLIARGLEPARLQELIAVAVELHLAPLVEVFTPTEAAIAVRAGAPIVGVNTRDLATFRVDRSRAGAIRRELPASVLTVCESGVDGPLAMAEAADAGFDAVLVGETLLRAADPGRRVRELLTFESTGEGGAA